MTSREKVFSALRHQSVWPVPISLRLCTELQQAWSRCVADPYLPDIHFIDFALSEQDGLAICDDQLHQAACRTEQIKGQGTVVATRYLSGVYEPLKHRLGVAKTLTDMYDHPSDLKRWIADMTREKCSLMRRIRTIQPDIYWIGDDLGTQTNLIMSPEQYRDFYYPAHKEIVSCIKANQPEAVVAFHSCGHIMPLVPDLIDMGVDVLEAIQPEAGNDLALLKSTYGDKLCFWGGIGLQNTFLDSDDVVFVAQIRQIVRLMGANGGYICAPCQMIDQDVSPERVALFLQTVQETTS